MSRIGQTIQQEEAKEARTDIEVQVFRTFEEVASMKQGWDEFMESIGAEIFLAYDWCRVWWKYYGEGRELIIFIFRCDGTISGIFPLCLDHIWFGPLRTRAIKFVGTDFMPIAVSVPVRPEVMARVIPRLLSELHSRLQWNILHIGPICGKYGFFEDLVRACRQNPEGSFHITTKTSDVHTYFQLADSWEKQIASLSPRQRTKTRRIYKEIQSKGTKLESSFASKDSFGQMFEAFVVMHQSYWNKLGQPGHFGAWPASYEFHGEISRIQLDRNRLRLLGIKLDDQCIGYEYMYKLGSTYYWFLSARADLGNDSRIDFHRVAFGEKVEKAIKENVKYIDSMQAKYEYKIVMGGKLFPIRNIFICPATLHNRIRIRLFRSIAWILDICYSKLWRARIAPRLGIRLGSFWLVWIRSHKLSW